MIFGIQELSDFLEILKDKVDLKKYFEEISKQGLEGEFLLSASQTKYL